MLSAHATNQNADMNSSTTSNAAKEVVRDMVRNMMADGRNPDREVSMDSLKCIKCGMWSTLALNPLFETFLRSCLVRSPTFFPIVCSGCSPVQSEIHVHTTVDVIEILLLLTSEHSGRIYVVSSDPDLSGGRSGNVAVDMSSMAQSAGVMTALVNKIRNNEELGPIARSVGLDNL